MTPLNEQIRAIQKAKELLKKIDHPDFFDAINDAGTTLAALNLTKDLPDREEYLDKLFSLSDKILVADGLDHEKELEQQVALMTFDAIKEREARIGGKDERIKELEVFLKRAHKELDGAYAFTKWNSDSIKDAAYKFLEEIESLLNNK